MGFLKLFFLTANSSKGVPGGSAVKNPHANAGDAGSVPGSGRSNILPRKILWAEEPGRLQSMGSQKSQI